jgi:carbamoyltransferase
VHQLRSDIPAVTHVDYSARVQTVSKDVAPRFHSLLKAFEERTGCGVVINTSFNVRGEPIVCTPRDAYRCFMRTGIDYLALGSFLLDKTQQPVWQDKSDRRNIDVLD